MHGVTQGQPSVGAPDRSPRASILVVEDHELLAQTLALALSQRGFDCAAAQLTGPVGVLQQARRLRPALVLLDLTLDGSDGLDLIPGLRALGAKVLVVTGCTEDARVAAALSLGASGWVAKAQPFERLLEAAEAVIRDRPLLADARHEELVRLGSAWLEDEHEVRERMARLTCREREVLWALSEGESAQQIAQALTLSIGTVRSHIQAILGKLGVGSQLAAVARARLVLTPDEPPRRPG
jgi:DNA-binding NarL/FixJ family response regulator